MAPQDVYRELSKKLLMEQSTVLPKIWETICSEEEAQIVNSLPATVPDLAEKFSKSEDEMNAIIEELYHRGVVFDYEREGKTFYRMPRHIIQFHDATLLWDEAPDEMMDRWLEFEETDYPALLELVTQIKMPSFMRVIPINETIASKSQVLSFEDAAKMLERANTIAVTTCVCRKLMKRCESPLEACLQINKGADYTLKRGTGRKIDLTEAMDILKLSEEAGLVHMTENTQGRNNVICNCCSCCCEMLRFATDTKTKGVLAPSRYLAQVDESGCTSCGMCVDICPVEAITLNEEDLAQVDAQGCIGCGLCASTCPVDAISLIDIRAEDFIPA
jgi:ferredoxin